MKKSVILKSVLVLSMYLSSEAIGNSEMVLRSTSLEVQEKFQHLDEGQLANRMLVKAISKASSKLQSNKNSSDVEVKRLIDGGLFSDSGPVLKVLGKTGDLGKAVKRGLAEFQFTKMDLDPRPHDLELPSFLPELDEFGKLISYATQKEPVNQGYVLAGQIDLDFLSDAEKLAIFGGSVSSTDNSISIVY